MLSFLTSLLALAGLLQGPGIPPKPAPVPPIVWSAGRPLTAADFLARPRPGEPLAALSTTDLKAGAACADFVFTGTVQATFDPNTSWFRSPKTVTPALLRHEQLHFDLTEVHARMLRQKLVAFGAKANCLKLQPAFNNLTKLVYQDWNREQNRYDQDSNHGLNPVRQAFWEQQTQQKLEALKAFAL